MYNKIVELKNGSKVVIWSDNEDCTLHVYDAESDYDSDFDSLELINYSDVKAVYLKDLAFYRYDPLFPPKNIE